MFKRIGKQSSLRIRATVEDGELSFVNGLVVDETAAVYHFGLEGFVGRTREGRVIRTKYQFRALLGFGREGQEFLDEGLKHLTGERTFFCSRPVVDNIWPAALTRVRGVC